MTIAASDNSLMLITIADIIIHNGGYYSAICIDQTDFAIAHNFEQCLADTFYLAVVRRLHLPYKSLPFAQHGKAHKNRSKEKFPAHNAIVE